MLNQIVYADIPIDYCYDQGMGGYICFEMENIQGEIGQAG
jgi:hypothetical protein